MYPFVGTKALAKALGSSASGVMISQVVPSPASEKYPWVMEYQRMVKAKGAELSYTSLEGFIAARIIVEALGGWRRLTRGADPCDREHA